MPELGDAPLEKQYKKQMESIAAMLDELFNGQDKGKARQTGFVLLVFPYNQPAKGDGRCNFISNGADRKDVVTLMKEMIARFQGQPEMKGNG